MRDTHDDGGRGTCRVCIAECAIIPVESENARAQRTGVRGVPSRRRSLVHVAITGLFVIASRTFNRDPAMLPVPMQRHLPAQRTRQQRWKKKKKRKTYTPSPQSPFARAPRHSPRQDRTSAIYPTRQHQEGESWLLQCSHCPEQARPPTATSGSRPEQNAPKLAGDPGPMTPLVPDKSLLHPDPMVQRGELLVYSSRQMLLHISSSRAPAPRISPPRHEDADRTERPPAAQHRRSSHPPTSRRALPTVAPSSITIRFNLGAALLLGATLTTAESSVHNAHAAHRARALRPAHGIGRRLGQVSPVVRASRDIGRWAFRRWSLGGEGVVGAPVRARLARGREVRSLMPNPCSAWVGGAAYIIMEEDRTLGTHKDTLSPSP
ncbi:hypothetical protein QBC39DRAFT_174925 [Podospora conica]|nr:hypothetical protein QBC39DRAFT_174925 [Schizothecium conicum]